MTAYILKTRKYSSVCNSCRVHIGTVKLTGLEVNVRYNRALGFLCQSLSKLQVANVSYRPSISSFKLNPSSLSNLRLCSASFHTCPVRAGYRNTEFEETTPTKVGRARLSAPNWHKYNDIVYKPTEPGQPIRPAEICHSRFQIKYSTKKLWYIAVMVRGLSIDEALKQLSFHKRIGAAHVKEVLEEAQDKAVKEHNVEFKSNLWICDSFATKGIIVRGLRRHARGRFGRLDHRYSHYFVRLREGRPPKHYYPAPKTGTEKMEEYLRNQRARKIPLGL